MSRESGNRNRLTSRVRVPVRPAALPTPVIVVPVIPEALLTAAAPVVVVPALIVPAGRRILPVSLATVIVWRTPATALPALVEPIGRRVLAETAARRILPEPLRVGGAVPRVILPAITVSIHAKAWRSAVAVAIVTGLSSLTSERSVRSLLSAIKIWAVESLPPAIAVVAITLTYGSVVSEGPAYTEFTGFLVLTGGTVSSPGREGVWVLSVLAETIVPGASRLRARIVEGVTVTYRLKALARSGFSAVHWR